MKILHCITGLDVGGAETMLYRLATRMDVVRFQSRVVSLLPPGPMGKRLTEAGIPVDSLNMRRGIPSPAGLARLVRTIRSWKPDVIQTWLYHADLAGLIATRLAFPFGGGPKVAWNIRCSYMALEEYRKLTGVTLKACARLSNSPDLILTNSEAARQFHMELGYTPRRFEVIPNGFDMDRFKPDSEARIAMRNTLSIEPDTRVIGHVARFDAMKDHRTFIQAAAKAAHTQEGLVFVLAGRGVDYDNTDIAGWMAEAGLPAERIRLLGEVANTPELMATMDVHVSSSIGESFPNVVGESMACGVPNVVTDVGDSARIVGETGEVVLPRDPDGLTKAMLRLTATSPEDRKQLTTAARKRIEEHYSLPSVIDRMSRLYETL